MIFRIISTLFYPQTKICFRQALEGDDIPPFLPKICRGQANGTPLCKKVDLDMNCFEISRLAGLL